MQNMQCTVGGVTGSASDQARFQDYADKLVASKTPPVVQNLDHLHQAIETMHNEFLGLRDRLQSVCSPTPSAVGNTQQSQPVGSCDIESQIVRAIEKVSLITDQARSLRQSLCI